MAEKVFRAPLDKSEGVVKARFAAAVLGSTASRPERLRTGAVEMLR
jgi:hypothetical protein